jgi:hypothetical protein
MRTLILSSLLLFSLPAAAGVSVAFLDSSRFTDAGTDPAEVARNTAEIAKHLEGLGDKYLKPDQTLTIEVLDIDLAGRSRMHRGSVNDIRVLNGGADWPRIKLKYTLQAKGEPPRSAEENLSDMNYMMNPDRTGASLAYEKRMLDQWFRARFAQRTR